MSDAPHGVLVVDKPPGMTSHDVVSRVRRAFRTRAVGHAGTLDPMATGVLVVAIGEATKLVPWLTADDKSYDATLRLGTATDSLDADGAVTETASVPELTRDEIRDAANAFLGPHAQRAPAVSAIKVDGVRLHARARRGEVVEPPLRDVVLHEVAIRAYEARDVELSLRCGKGFYVRSFGRDLAARLGTLGHLTALRRTASGRFDLAASVGLDALDGADLLSLPDAATRLLPPAILTEGAAEAARCGRRIHGVEGDEVAALHQGKLVAVLRRDPNDPSVHRVVRGFAPV
ncbi:MAG: tRNA pseudouridine(55) synthase TruB [Myxococcales bacterium]|nr:tRNA pseudouridine(55) synthase TruB [Myxococcales bacterium]